MDLHTIIQTLARFLDVGTMGAVAVLCVWFALKKDKEAAEAKERNLQLAHEKLELAEKLLREKSELQSTLLMAQIEAAKVTEKRSFEVTKELSATIDILVQETSIEKSVRLLTEGEKG